MATIQLERGADGAFLRVERFHLPGNNGSIFSRLYAKVLGGRKYELVRNFQCPFLVELRCADDPPFHICVATDDGEGRMEIIEPKYLAPCGMTVLCRHICQYKKKIAKGFLDYGLLPRMERHRLDVFVTKTDDTIKLNPEVLACDR